MLKTTHIRQAEVSDIEAMVGLLGELFAVEADFTFDADRQRRGLLLLLRQDAAEVLVAESGGVVVGMCTMQRLVSTAEGGWAGLIEDVVVTSSHRRHGIASRLLATMVSRAAELGLERLQLLVDRTNIPALGFYAVSGWQPTRLRALRRQCP